MKTETNERERKGHSAESQKKDLDTFGVVPFLTYVATLTFMQNRLKGEILSAGVHIPQKEIEARFFPWPQFDRKKELDHLIKTRQLAITEDHSPITGRKMLRYCCMVPMPVDMATLNFKVIPHGYEQLAGHLLKVSLKAGAPSTEYFDLFLKHKAKHLAQFFSVDDFCQRIHTPITNFHRIYRPNILLDYQPTTSFDIAQSQPTILGKILQDVCGDNQFSDWINQGQDIYTKLQQAANLPTRDEGKKRFFEILFSKPSEALQATFGDERWIAWINDYKRSYEARNPHSKGKPHSNMAWLLSTTEVAILRKVWRQLIDSRIPFLTVHDEIITDVTNGRTAESLFRKVLDSEFQTYELRSKI